MEIEVIVKWTVAVIVMVIMIWAAVFLLKGKGGALLGSIRDVLRFGR